MRFGIRTRGPAVFSFALSFGPERVSRRSVVV